MKNFLIAAVFTLGSYAIVPPSDACIGYAGECDSNGVNFSADNVNWYLQVLCGDVVSGRHCALAYREMDFMEQREQDS